MKSESISKLWDNFQRPNIHLIGGPDKEHDWGNRKKCLKKWWTFFFSNDENPQILRDAMKSEHKKYEENQTKIHHN